MRKFVELELDVLKDLDKTLLVSDGDKSVFLPKSMIEYTFTGEEGVTVQLPEWLAHKKGLI